jgi:hypothetical protein
MDQLSLTSMVQGIKKEGITVKWAAGVSTVSRMGATCEIALHYKADRRSTHIKALQGADGRKVMYVFLHPHMTQLHAQAYAHPVYAHQSMCT